MQLRRAPYGGNRWNEGLALMNNHLTVPLSFTPRGGHQMWVLEETGRGTFDEVTEEMTGQPIAGVILTESDMYSSMENMLVVHPDYRNQRWGYRMLRYALDNFHDQLFMEVDTANWQAMAFAAKYGQFQDSRQRGGRLIASVRFSYGNENWLHAGCRCAYCVEEISSLTRLTSRAR